MHNLKIKKLKRIITGKRISSAIDARFFLSLFIADFNTAVIKGQKNGVIPKDNALLDEWYVNQANGLLEQLGIIH